MARNLKKMTDALNRLDLYRRYAFHTTLKESEVYMGQPPILDYLLECESCTQRELSTAIHVSPASMAVSIKRMEKIGLVERIADSEDLRCNRVTITQKGREQIAETHRKFDKLDEALFAGFSDEELKELFSYVERLTRNIAKDIHPDESVMEMFKREICDHEKESD